MPSLLGSRPHPTPPNTPHWPLQRQGPCGLSTSLWGSPWGSFEQASSDGQPINCVVYAEKAYGYPARKEDYASEAPLAEGNYSPSYTFQGNTSCANEGKEGLLLLLSHTAFAYTGEERQWLHITAAFIS